MMLTGAATSGPDACGGAGRPPADHDHVAVFHASSVPDPDPLDAVQQ